MDTNDLKDNQKFHNWLIDEKPFKKQPLLIFCLTLLITLVFHTAIFYSFKLLKKDKTLLVKKSEAKTDYELVYYEPLQIRFVETNTDIEPQEPPKNTINFAAQSQQASQLNPSLPSLEDFPTLEGEHEIWSKIVQGSLVAQEEIIPIETNKTSNIEPQKEMPDGIKLWERPKPKPRPKLNPSHMQPLKRNEGAVTKFGHAAVNARFTQFGLYTQKMFEAIDYQVLSLFANYNPTAQDFNSYIHVSYSLDENGKIINMAVESATASNLAIILCKDAIQSSAPYGPWTDDMKAILNKEERFSYYFHIL